MTDQSAALRRPFRNRNREQIYVSGADIEAGCRRTI